MTYKSERDEPATVAAADDETQQVVIMDRFSDFRVAPVFSIRHTLFMALFCMLLFTASSDRSTASACASCLNGGQLTLPTTIFGFCSCKCAPRFVGPRCQFMSYKRSEDEPYSASDFYRMLKQQMENNAHKRSGRVYTNDDDDNSSMFAYDDGIF